MCIDPGVLPNGQLVGCRKCWQCKELRVNDWVGRNIAESKTALACHFVTLTYGRMSYDERGNPVPDRYGSEDHVRAAVLTYSDVQKFFKKLRKAGFRFRYFAIGEYGSAKARSHWHVLMYWLGPAPKVVLNKRAEFPPWEHGFCKWERIKDHTGAVRYACKYITKDIGDPERQGHISMSKKPPLGTEYFERLAQKYVDQGLAPQSLKYGWRDVVNKKREPLKFMMRGAVAEKFVIDFEHLWRVKYGEKSHSPHSDAVQEVLDRIVRREDFGSWELYKAGLPWGKTPPGADEMRKHQMFGKWYLTANGTRYWWDRNPEGEFEWMPTSDAASASEGMMRPKRNASKLLQNGTPNQP